MIYQILLGDIAEKRWLCNGDCCAHGGVVECKEKCCAAFTKQLTAGQDILATGSVILRNYLVMPEHLLYPLVAFCSAFDFNLLEPSTAIYGMYHAVNPA